MTNETKPEIKLSYEERQALPVIRKLLMRKPEAANLIMQGMAKEVATRVLLQAKKELDDLLAVAHAFSVAAGELVKLDQPKESNHD
jgi:predicted DNA-binding protein (UPF0251 family)